MIKVFTAFSGYDTQCLALERLKRDFPAFDYELVGWSEIDKYAIQAHNALFPEWADRNFGDISKIDWQQVPDFDLFTYSSPCQDFSNAGLQRGGEEGSGTRSSLLWECRRAIVAKRPKYLILENVKALVSKKFLPLFNKWIKSLEDYGYYNTWQVLNAKDYGVAQNRPRVFMISVSLTYHFPKAFTLEKRLRDYLEPVVDEKYYLSDKFIKGYIDHCDRKQSEGCGFKFEPTFGDGIAKTISTLAGCRQTDNFIIEPRVMQVGNIWPDTEKFKNRTMGRVYNPDGISPTINCCGGGDREPKIIQRAHGFNKGNVFDICPTITSSAWQNNNLLSLVKSGEYRIRKLTPRECFRLMGVDDADIDKIQASGISNSQQYKCAGNSIVVDVLYNLFRKMFCETRPEMQ